MRQKDEDITKGEKKSWIGFHSPYQKLQIKYGKLVKFDYLDYS